MSTVLYLNVSRMSRDIFGSKRRNEKHDSSAPGSPSLRAGSVNEPEEEDPDGAAGRRIEFLFLPGGARRCVFFDTSDAI